MITFDATQNTIVAAGVKTVSWLFEVTKSGSGSVDYYWSTKDYTFDSQAYTAAVFPDSFDGLTITRSNSELGIQAPDDLSFSIDGTGITAADLIDAQVHLKLVIDDGTDEEIIRQVKFIIDRAYSTYGQIQIECVGFLDRYLKGDYPNTPLVSSIFPDDTRVTDNLCVPVPFGTVYIPLRSSYISDGRYYILGLDSHTYDITEVQSPRSWPSRSTWQSGSYSFTKSAKTDAAAVDWKVFQPIIADADGDGTPDACGLWLSGNAFLDALVKFSRTDDTGSMTDPEDIIEFVLEEMGVPSGAIDTAGTFATSGATYTSWGLDWAGAYFYKQARETVLAQLQTMCHSILSVEDKVRLRPYSTASMATLTGADIARDSWDYSLLTPSGYDSAYIAMPAAGDPQDKLYKYRVSATGSYANLADEVLELPFVADTQAAQKLGILHYQYRFLQYARATFTAHEKHLALEPGDFITINANAYGGTYKVMIDSMHISADLELNIQAIVFSADPDDWDDLSPGAVTPAADDSTTVWNQVVSGPDGSVTSGTEPNALMGSYRILDADGNLAVRVGRDVVQTSGILGTDGELLFGTDGSGILGTGDAAGTDQRYGIFIYNTAGDQISRFHSGGFRIGGPTNAENFIEYDAATGIFLFSSDSEHAITIAKGGDITLAGDTYAGNNPGKMIFAEAENELAVEMYAYYSALFQKSFYLQPAGNDNDAYLYSTGWYGAYIEANTYTRLKSYNEIDSDNSSTALVRTTASGLYGNATMEVATEIGGVSVTSSLGLTRTGIETLLILNDVDAIYPVGNPCSLGKSAYLWDRVYAKGLYLGLATESFAVIDAGSTGATEQDWIEVEVDGDTGYIRIYASK